MRMKCFVGLILWATVTTSVIWAQEAQTPLTLEESIKIAMERSPALHSAVMGVEGSEFRRKEAITNFLPLWTGQYSWTRYSSPVAVGPIPIFLPELAPITSKDIYNFSATVNQPLFTGGLNLANYRLAKIGLDFSKETVGTAKRDLVLEVRVGYFTIIRAERFLEVAQQQVEQFEAQLELTEALFRGGLVVENDVLQAEVNLANARQSQVKAANDVAKAKESFNVLLRREITTPLEVVDILAYEAFPLSYEECLEEAFQRRPEIKAAQLNIDQAKENVKIAKSGFFPKINLLGSYGRFSDELSENGIKMEGWLLQASATFTLWNWGNTAFKVGEDKVRVSQAEDSKTQLIDSVTLEVRDGYRNMRVAEKNIKVAEKAIEQAEENLKMFEGRYKFQVATQTDVIIAVTLLAQARTNYYGALSDFNVAKAQLERAMGRLYP